MSTPSTTPTPSAATLGTTDSFLGSVSFDDLYAGLAEHGFTLPPDKRETFEKTAKRRLREFNGMGDTGFDFTNILTMVISLLKRFFSPEAALGDGAGFAQHLNNSTTDARAKGRQKMLLDAMGRIAMDLQQAGFDPRVTELITSTRVHAVGEKVTINNMHASLYHQIGRALQQDGVIYDPTPDGSPGPIRYAASSTRGTGQGQLTSPA
jgi:hypothetical protein